MKFLEDFQMKEEEQSSQTPDYIDNITDPTKLPYHLTDSAGGERRERRYKQLRMSEIDSSCIREWVLGYCLDLYYYENVRFANMFQMDLGSAFHSFVQNNPKYFGDRLVGWWQCMACGHIRRFGVRPTEPCEKCHAHPRVTEYYEYMFRLTSPYRTVGKLDGILRVKPRTYRFLEIKTTAKEVDQPDGAHIAQIAACTYFSRYDDQLPITIDRSVCYLAYFSKTFSWNGTMKIFPIRVTEALISPLREKARIITEGINTKTLPGPLEKCVAGGFSQGRAKKCGISKDCKKHFDLGTVQL